MGEPTDTALLQAWGDGDERAGNELVRRHFSAVFRFFRAKIDGNVDDLTQGTFVACLEGAARFRGDSSFRGYILGIARIQLFAHLRKHYKHGAVFDPAAQSMTEAGAASGPSPASLLAGQQHERLVLAALRRIPLDFQIAVELFYWEELPMAEIAQVLNIAVGTVKSRLGRARAMLREQVAALADSDELKNASLDDIERWAQSLRGRFGLRDGEP
ncbi:MAG: RNA polymerase sigma factor [Myxococcota bacterium]